MAGAKGDLLNWRPGKKRNLELWQSTCLWGLTSLLSDTNNDCRGLMEMHTAAVKLHSHERN